ncbi:MAG: enoyl-CoA hydratase-related protein [Pseudomonadota bacterium]
MDYKHILFEETDHIARITLNIPEKRNVLNLEIRYELLDAFRRVAEEDSIKVLVITGAGKAFCSGGDLGTMEGVTPVAGRVRLKKGQRLIKAMVELEKPIIGAINGVTAGAGVSIALACDILIASEEAKFVIPFTKLGLVPDWGQFYFLPLRVGIARAKELMFMAETIDAREADRLGLVNRIVPAEKLEEEVLALATRLARGPTQAYAMIKAALNRWPASLESLLELESTMQAVAFASDDFDEGRKAFLEKRKPMFHGK